MPRSRVRGGRKAHNKRVKKRNETIKSEFKRASELAWKKFEEHKAQQIIETDNSDGIVIPDFK